MKIEEPVGTGYSCVLIADQGGWKLRFAFPGPDRRYNWTFVTVWPNEVPHFREHLLSAFEKYLTLKPVVQDKAKFEETFGYVTMRIGGVLEGVCVGGYHLRFRDRDNLNDFVSTLDRVPTRGDQLYQPS